MDSVIVDDPGADGGRTARDSRLLARDIRQVRLA